MNDIKHWTSISTGKPPPIDFSEKDRYIVIDGEWYFQKAGEPGQVPTGVKAQKPNKSIYSKEDDAVIPWDIYQSRKDGGGSNLLCRVRDSSMDVEVHRIRRDLKNDERTEKGYRSLANGR